MNMRVLNHDNIGEIMAGYFPVPQNPIDVGMAGLSGGCGCGSKRRPTLNGLGQTCADGTAYVTNFGCDDGSTPTCPSGYTLSTVSGQYSCVAPGATTLIGSPAPSASTTSIPTSLISGVIVAAVGIMALTKL